MKVSTFLPLYASRAQGWIFLVLGFSMFSGFLYVAIIAKFLPVSENHVVAAIQNDRLFHGQNGVVLLSGKSFFESEKLESESSQPPFNPLAAKVATISVSAFGPGGPFGFHSFSEMWKNQKKNSRSSKKESSKILLLLGPVDNSYSYCCSLFPLA